MSVLPLPTPDRRVVRCANERCNRILRRPPINGLGPECAKAAGFEAPSAGRLRVARQDGPDLFDQHEEINEGDAMPNIPTTTVAEYVDDDLTEQIAWDIHSSYPCSTCSCGGQRCAEPRFPEIQAAARIVSHLTSAGLLSSDHVQVTVTHSGGADAAR